jgi:hypothetical protein
MQQEELYREPSVAPSDAYERSDLNPRWIVIFGIGILVATALAVLITSLIIYYKATQYTKGEVPLPRLAKEREINPQPRLEVDAPSQLREMRAGEDARLSSYGWVDKDAGIVRIPIDRAMEILASQGLPARKTEPAGK